MTWLQSNANGPDCPQLQRRSLARYFFSRSSVASLRNIGRRRFAAFARSQGKDTSMRSASSSTSMLAVAVWPSARMRKRNVSPSQVSCSIAIMSEVTFGAREALLDTANRFDLPETMADDGCDGIAHGYRTRVAWTCMHAIMIERQSRQLGLSACGRTPPVTRRAESVPRRPAKPLRIALGFVDL